MTMHQLHRQKPLLNLRVLCAAAQLSYEAIGSKLYRYGVQGRKSELTAPESQAIDGALARLFHGAGLTVTRPSTTAATGARPTTGLPATEIVGGGTADTASGGGTT